MLEEAVKRHGRPAGILTDHGSQFYTNEREAARRGESDYEKKLVGMGIRQSLARIKHPQTNGKLERFHSEIDRHLKSFEEESACNTVSDSRPGDHVGSPFHAAGTTDPMPRLVGGTTTCHTCPSRKVGRLLQRHMCASRRQKT